MEKIMKLAGLLREAKALVEEINNEGEYNILRASVEIDANAPYTDGKQAEIFFYRGMEDLYVPQTRKLLNTDDGKTYEDSVKLNGVKFYHLVTEGENNASLAI